MLTDAQIRKLRPLDKTYRLSDADGLYLIVRPSGNKSWMLRYQIKGVRRDKTLGRYPALSLREARAIVNAARTDIERRTDPFSEVKQYTLNEAAEILLQKKKEKNAKRYYRSVCRRYEMYIYPKFGRRNIEDISTAEIRDSILEIETKGTVATAFHVQVLWGEIFRFAIQRGFAEYDASQALRGLISVNTKHYAYINDKKILAQVLRAIDNANLSVGVLFALKILPYVFVRINELLRATWDEFDFEKRIWRIPPERMKKRRLHIVPLSDSVLKLLNELKESTGAAEGLVFPGGRCSCPIGLSTPGYALKRLGFDSNVIVPHGFRATASTFLHEAGFDHLVIERQLAHVQGNHVAAAYNHAQYLDQRREMMEYWSDFLDGLRDNG